MLISLGIPGSFFAGLAGWLSPLGLFMLVATIILIAANRRSVTAATGIAGLAALLVTVPLGIVPIATSHLLTQRAGVLQWVAAGVLLLAGLVVAAVWALGSPGKRAADPAAAAARSDSSLSTAAALASVAVGLAAGYVITQTGLMKPDLNVTIAAAEQPWHGAVYLAAYVLGLFIPAAILAAVWDATGVRTSLGGRATAMIAAVFLVFLGAAVKLTDAFRELPNVISPAAAGQVRRYAYTCALRWTDLAAVLGILVLLAILVALASLGPSAPDAVRHNEDADGEAADLAAQPAHQAAQDAETEDGEGHALGGTVRAADRAGSEGRVTEVERLDVREDGLTQNERQHGE